MRRWVAPVPWRDAASLAAGTLLQAYMGSSWRSDATSLLQFLRKTNKDGRVAQYLRRRWLKERLGDEELEAFANRTQLQGEIMIAVITHSRFSDNFFGQWTLLRVPFRAVQDLWRPEVDLVPEGYRHFALALLHRPDFWRDEAQVRSELELEAFRDHFVVSNLAMVRAHTAIVDGYFSGRLVLGVDAPPERAAHVAAPAVQLDR